MKQSGKEKTKQMIIMGLLTALAYLSVFYIHIPTVEEWLKYEPADVIITLGAFIYGPLSGVIMSVLVALIEFFTISTTGPIGLLMNIISTCFYAVTASLIYKKMRTMKGAVIGLVSGTIAMTVAMILWNYLITPFYMGVPRDVVAGMLVPVFLPFNLIKASLNSALLLMIYKPLTDALKKAHMIPDNSKSENNYSVNANKKTKYMIIFACAIVIIAICALLLLKFNNII